MSVPAQSVLPKEDVRQLSPIPASESKSISDLELASAMAEDASVAIRKFPAREVKFTDIEAPNDAEKENLQPDAEKENLQPAMAERRLDDGKEPKREGLLGGRRVDEVWDIMRGSASRVISGGRQSTLVDSSATVMERTTGSQDHALSPLKHDNQQPSNDVHAVRARNDGPVPIPFINHPHSVIENQTLNRVIVEGNLRHDERSVDIQREELSERPGFIEMAFTSVGNVAGDENRDEREPRDARSPLEYEERAVMRAWAERVQSPKHSHGEGMFQERLIPLEYMLI